MAADAFPFPDRRMDRFLLGQVAVAVVAERTGLAADNGRRLQQVRIIGTVDEVAATAISSSNRFMDRFAGTEAPVVTFVAEKPGGWFDQVGFFRLVRRVAVETAPRLDRLVAERLGERDLVVTGVAEGRTFAAQQFFEAGTVGQVAAAAISLANGSMNAFLLRQVLMAEVTETCIFNWGSRCSLQ